MKTLYKKVLTFVHIITESSTYLVPSLQAKLPFNSNTTSSELTIFASRSTNEYKLQNNSHRIQKHTATKYHQTSEVNI